MFKVDFIVRAYTSPDATFLTTTKVSSQKDQDKLINLDESIEELGAVSLDPNDNAVQCVSDVLPHLNQKVIKQLLERYESTELAISAVLEGNLPPDLQDLLNESTTSGGSIKETEKETKSKNMEFFGFDKGADVIVKRQKGFPGQPKNLKTMLNDKSHINELRSRYEEYGLISDNEYDDEYDDSYDGLAASEAKTVRTIDKSKYIIASELQDDDAYGAEEDDEIDNDDNEDNGGYRDRSKDFCENPEVMRDRRAQAWNNRISAKGGSRPQAPRSK